jgi:hypothetical protein
MAGTIQQALFPAAAAAAARDTAAPATASVAGVAECSDR